MSLSVLRRARALALQAGWRRLLPVQLVPAPDQPDRRHDVPGHQAATARLDAGVAPVDLEQSQHGCAGADASPGRQLQDRLADEAQIMQVMAEREAMRRLSGFVQIDDAYLGGERNGGKAGRGSENKQPFLIAVQTDTSLTAPSFVVIEPVRSFDNVALTDWIARRLAPECEAYTDGLACFRRLEEAGHAHTTLDTDGGRAATEAAGARWVNVVLGNLKRAISGVYHAIAQGKYARRYLAEAAYRFNRRFRLREMLPRLATAMMRCKPCPEPVLHAASNFHG
ncbi:conserved hypothetical protein [Xanthomonas euvesicatoria pv. vesicatoria str. 85-10]|uniref:ISXO2-like transposase domain-containing protein n=1 Tax=Xanthomonas euvesicatoria pv. vesicatoria (strain 85-10) TaxID=316273 RepID=Q3BYJ6_XANE5|nr:conserved hypothetical protein [Xanthomonas euvesicatoria pv. vesicatoria str. 85-10]